MLAAFLAPQAVFAETVYLKSGTVLKGSVIDGGGTVEVVTSSGVARFSRDEIDCVEKDRFVVTLKNGQRLEGIIADVSAEAMKVSSANGIVEIPRADIEKVEPADSAPEASTATVTQSGVPVPAPPMAETKTAAQAGPYAEVNAAGQFKAGYFGKGVSGILELDAGMWLNGMKLYMQSYGAGSFSPGTSGLTFGAGYFFKFPSGFQIGARGAVLALRSETHDFTNMSVKTSGGVNILAAEIGYEWKGGFAPYARGGAGMSFTGINFNITNASVMNEGHSAGSAKPVFTALLGVKKNIGGAWLALEVNGLYVKHADTVLKESAALSWCPVLKISWVFN